MNDKALATAIVGLTIYGVYITVSSWSAIRNSDDYSQYSFTMQVILAVALGLAFWYFQRKDNDKMQLLLEKQTKLAEEMHTYISQQQQVQDSIRSRSLSYIKSSLESANELISKIANMVQSYKTTKERAKELQLFLEIVDIESHADTVEEHLSTVRSYIHAELAVRIENATKDIRMLSGSDEDDMADSFHIFAADITRSADDWLEQARKTNDVLTLLIEEIPK